MKKVLLSLSFLSVFSFVGTGVVAQEKQKEATAMSMTKADQQKKIAVIKEQIELNKNSPKYDMKAKKEELLRYENAIIIEKKK